MSDDADHSAVTELTLVIPASVDHIRFARLMASAVAARIGCDVDAVENVRIAVSELCTAVAESAPRGDLTLTYRGDADGVRVTGHALRTVGSSTPEAPSELTRLVLDAVADEHSLELGPTEMSFSLLLRATPPAT